MRSFVIRHYSPYIHRALEPGETIRLATTVSWKISYLPGLLLWVLAVDVLWLRFSYGDPTFLNGLALLSASVLFLAGVLFVKMVSNRPLSDSGESASTADLRVTGVLLWVLAVNVVWLRSSYGESTFLNLLALLSASVLFLIGLKLLVKGWFLRATTEFAVTDR